MWESDLSHLSENKSFVTSHDNQQSGAPTLAEVITTGPLFDTSQDKEHRVHAV